MKTPEEITVLKQEYNGYLMRHMRACVFLDDENVPISQREQWIPEYRTILFHLNRLLNVFDLEGVKYMVDEGLGGFDV